MKSNHRKINSYVLSTNGDEYEAAYGMYIPFVFFMFLPTDQSERLVCIIYCDWLKRHCQFFALIYILINLWEQSTIIEAYQLVVAELKQVGSTPDESVG